MPASTDAKGIHITITPEQRAELRRLAYEGDTSMTKVIHQAIAAWLAKHAKPKT